VSEHDVPDETPDDILETLDDRTAVALAEIDRRGRQAGAALRAAAQDRVVAARAGSNGAPPPADPHPAGPSRPDGKEQGPVAVEPAPAGPGSLSRKTRRPVWLAAAAAVLVLVALAGAVVATRPDGRDSVAMSEPGTAYLVPGWLPDGWQPRHPVLPEPFNTLAADEAVYGNGDAEDPWAGPLLEVTQFTDGSDDPPAQEGEPVTIGGREGVLFRSDGSWIATNGELAVSGSRGATREQVVAAAGHADDGPAIAPGGLPEGYQELARGGLDGVAGQLDGVETGVVVSYGQGAEDAAGQPGIVMLQRPGAAEAVDLARLYAEDSRPTTVRGHHAVIAVTSEGVQLQWLEPPGMLVTVDALRMSEDDARRFAEELRLAQPDELDDLAARYGVEDGAPAWAYEGRELPSGDASEGETGPATPEHDRLRTECTDGSMSACDQLWQTTDVGSDLEAFAETCGGRDPAGRHSGTCEQDFGDGPGPSDDEDSTRADAPADEGGPTTTTPDLGTRGHR
jgi:hypothetical protein